MVCRICLKELSGLINIFNEIDGDIRISEVVGKHFWFQPKIDDLISTVICKYCWKKVRDFHEFYKTIEASHRALQQSFLTKTDNKGNTDYFTNDLENYCYLLQHKRDVNEINFKTEDISLNEHKEMDIKINTTLGNVLSDYTFCDANSQETSLYYSKCAVVDDEKECQTHIENEIFPKSIRRKSAQRKTIIANSNKNKVHKLEKRDRLRKGKDLLKAKKTPKDHEAYKSKIKEYDAEIAKYMALYCDICNSKAENFPALRSHMRDVHNIQDGYVTCCNKKFNKRALLLYHIRQHLNPNCYRCEECDFTFSDRQSRHNHFLVKHQKDEDKIYACTQCPKKFVRKYLLEQHKSFSHRDFIPKCKNCSKRFKTASELTEHSKEDCYPGTMCDICAKCIRGTAAFKQHQLDHQGVALPKVQCDLCGFWYKDKRGLKRHQRKHIEAKELHVCDICQKVSPSRSAMLSHKRYAHGADRSHECNICQKTFKKPISLKEHMTTHTGEILYKCLHCPKTFNSNANMHSHRKKLHPKEFEEARKQRKQYVVSVCE